MNAIAVPFVLPFRLMGRFPVPSIIGSALLAILCYFTNQGSGLAFFICLSTGILMWHDETNLKQATPVLEDA
jgi:hypothetical protein